MVPAGARQIDDIAGSAGTASWAQAAAGTAYRCGIKHPGNTARFWPEGWCGDAQGVRGADSGVGDGPGHIRAHRRGDAIGAGCIEGGIRKAAQSCTCEPSAAFWQINAKSGDLQFCLAIQGESGELYRPSKGCIKVDRRSAKPL